ncbi:hypothetical protein KR009_005019, partial [Drosophila setifemur]
LQGNMRFHFTLDFHVKEPANSNGTFDKTIVVENNQISMVDNEATTKSPIETWTDQDQFNNFTLQKVTETRRSVHLLNTELSPLAGRSNDLARRLKISLRYVNEVDANLEHLTNFGQLVELLRKFIILIDTLRDPAQVGGVRSLEYVLLKLSLEKYDLLNKQEQIRQYLEPAESAWRKYQNTQVVLLDNTT